MEPLERRLSRARGDGRPAAPIRLAHLGLGNFHRSHQAWFTEQAPDAAEWGCAAFGGRGSATSSDLADQDGLFTLVTRGRDADTFNVIATLSRCHGATDHGAWLDVIATDAVAAVTMTATEAAYLGVNDPAVRADVAALAVSASAIPSTVPGRLAAGLVARYRAGAGPIAIIPCDNVASNGAAVSETLQGMAHDLDVGFAAWVAVAVAVVGTVSDRVTPRTTERDREIVARATGIRDSSPVVSEPFAEWVLAGVFPAGRPMWDAAGAKFVDDVAPYERRKLWLLNGAHSLLAYAGTIVGHETVASAIADDRCRSWVDAWWTEATRHLGAADVASYRALLLERFSNERVRHSLAQIAEDGSQKLSVRIVPVLRQEREAGRVPEGAVWAVAAWIAHLRGVGAPVVDVNADVVVPLAAGALREAVPRVLDSLAAEFREDSELVAAVMERTRELEALAVLHLSR